MYTYMYALMQDVQSTKVTTDIRITDSTLLTCASVVWCVAVELSESSEMPIGELLT